MTALSAQELLHTVRNITDDDTLFSGGGGYLLFMGDPSQGGFPRSLEIEGRLRDLLAPFAIGGMADYTYDPDAMRGAIHPLGEWNAVEIVSINGEVTAAVNGVTATRVRSHDYTEPGHITFQVQGAKMFWRNIRIRVE